MTPEYLVRHPEVERGDHKIRDQALDAILFPLPMNCFVGVSLCYLVGGCNFGRQYAAHLTIISLI